MDNRRNTIVMWSALGLAVLALVIAVYAVSKPGGAGLSGTAGLQSSRDSGTVVTGPFTLNCTKPATLNATFQYADGLGSVIELTESAKAGTIDMFTKSHSTTLTLKRTLGTDKSLSDWYGRHTLMQNCDFVLMDMTANASVPTIASQWSLDRRIVPIEYSIQTVDKDGNLLDKPLEVIKLDYDTFTRTK